MDPAVPQRIFDAACDGNVEEVEQFLASVDTPRDVVNCLDQIHPHATLLSCVTLGGSFNARHVKLARLLISHDADVNHIDSLGNTPLIYLLQCFGATCSGKAVIDMISLLLVAGANVNREGGERLGLIGGEYGFPISIVVGKLNRSNCPDSALIEEVVTMLLRAGASVDNSSARLSCNVRQALVDPHFITIQAYINGVHAAGSWRAYIMAPRLEVLTLRGLANRGKIRSADPALNNLVALPNELICQVLAFWFG